MIPRGKGASAVIPIALILLLPTASAPTVTTGVDFVTTSTGTTFTLSAAMTFTTVQVQSRTLVLNGIGLNVTPASGYANITIEIWDAQGETAFVWHTINSQSAVLSYTLTWLPRQQWTVYRNGELLGEGVTDVTGDVVFSAQDDTQSAEYRVSRESPGTIVTPPPLPPGAAFVFIACSFRWPANIVSCEADERLQRDLIAVRTWTVDGVIRQRSEDLNGSRLEFATGIPWWSPGTFRAEIAYEVQLITGTVIAADPLLFSADTWWLGVLYGGLALVAIAAAGGRLRTRRPRSMPRSRRSEE